MQLIGGKSCRHTAYMAKRLFISRMYKSKYPEVAKIAAYLGIILKIEQNSGEKRGIND